MDNNTLVQMASNYFLDIIVDYVDIDYSLWLSWLLMPLLITFLLPAIIVLLFYLSAIIFHIYKLYRQDLVGGNSSDWRERGTKVVAAIWDAHGWLWHGYEISGLEDVPTTPVLYIFYHGALPVDMYYFLSKIYLYKNNLIHTVADRLLFKIPGWAIFLESLHVIPGTVQQCVGVLREGNQLAIAPGGVYEAQFGSEYYRLLWKQRRGFAKVALEAKVPIVPVFTMNLREAFRTVGLLRRLFLWVYTVTRVPLAPVYGGFPVKLQTHLGKPIPHDGTLTPDELHQKVVLAMEELIEEHQRIPGSITRGLVERIYIVPKTKKLPPKVAEDLAEKLKEQEDVKSELKKKLLNLDSLKSELETNLETLNLSDFPPEVVKTNGNVKSETDDVKPDINFKTNDFESSDDVKTNDFESSDDVKTNDFESSDDVKTNDFETNDDKSDGVEISEVKFNGVEHNDVSSNVVKTNGVKFKDVKFDGVDVKSNEVMYNDVIISKSVTSSVAKRRKSRDSPQAKNEVIFTNGNTVKEKES